MYIFAMSVHKELSAAEFLRRFFDHLTLDDLKTNPDKTLQGLADYFVSANLREIPQEDRKQPKKYEPVANPVGLFDVYIAYLNRETVKTVDQRAEEFIGLLDDIKRVDLELKAAVILSRRKTAADFSPALETLAHYTELLRREEEKQRAKTSPAAQNSFTMSKKLGLRVIGEAIRLSYVKKEPDESVEIESQHKTHQEQAEIVLQETRAEFQVAGLTMPKPIEDKRFRKRNDLLVSHTTTAKRIAALLTMDTASVLKQGYMFDARALIPVNLRAKCSDFDFDGLNDAQQLPPTPMPVNAPQASTQQASSSTNAFIGPFVTLPTVEVKETAGLKVIVHMKSRSTPPLAMWPANPNNAGRLILRDCSPLAYAYEQRNKNVVYLAGTNPLNIGGMADQGFDSQIEAPMYHATTYSAALETCTTGFPVPVGTIIYLPNVLFVKTPVEPYEMLSGAASGRIRILCAASLYRPEVDDKGKFVHADRFRAALLAGFIAAYAFGYRDIIMDDRGIDDYLLPAGHAIELIVGVIHAIKHAFASITLCEPRSAYLAAFRAAGFS